MRPDAQTGQGVKPVKTEHVASMAAFSHCSSHPAVFCMLAVLNTSKMSTDKFTFPKPRFLSDIAVTLEKPVDNLYDLITFLAAVQRAKVDILPITWQSARRPIGMGGTSNINKASINLETSFAFKCVSDTQKRDQDEAKILQALISEIAVLSHPSIREHPNIIELQGICWDVPSDHEVWPVLVFEEAQFGDLYNFATLPVGRDLCIAERLKLCVDIGTAIIDMHFNSKLLKTQMPI